MKLLRAFLLLTATSAIDLDVVTQAKGDIEALITGTQGLAPKILRLAFHDAVGGGNDGKSSRRAV